MAVSARYELIEVVGSGGMATVWRARDVRLGRIVALKRPHPAPPGSEVYARFAREARTAAMVSHPNLVAVFDVGDDDGPYLVMEYVDAPSLDRAPVGPAGIATVGSQIAAGLVALHAAGIVHGDVKPANILLAPDGAKLADFGIARPLDATTLTSAGAISATPAYAAPEVLTHGQRSPASDVYSLAAVLFELVTGERFDAASTAVPASIATDDDWRALLEPALSPVAADRPSAAELAGRLSRLATGPSTARAATVRTPVTPPTPTVAATVPASAPRGSRRRRRLPLAAGSATALLAVVGLVAVAAAMADDPDTPSTSVPAGSTPPSTSVPAESTAPSTSVSTEATTGPDVAATASTSVATTSVPDTSERLSTTTTAVLPTGPRVADPHDTHRRLVGLVLAATGERDDDDEDPRVVDELDEAIESADDGDLEKTRRKLRDAAKRIDRHIEADAIRVEATALLMELSEQLGVDPETLTEGPGRSRRGDDD